MKLRLLVLLLVCVGLNSDLRSENSRLTTLTVKHSFADIACNDFINLSLDSTCHAVAQLEMLIEDQTGPNSDYLIQIWDGNVLRPNLDFWSADRNKIFRFVVYNIPRSNSCWGWLKIEDKFPPVLECASDTIRCGESIEPETNIILSKIGFPIPNTNWKVDSRDTFPERNSNNPKGKPFRLVYKISGWDACGLVRLSYIDNELIQDCESDFSKIIYRCWTAVDETGNKSECCDTIYILRADFVDIVTPHDYDGYDRPHLRCNGLYPKLPNGHPDPIFTGYPVPDGCDKLIATYSDLKFNICENSYKIIRRWTILNWCSKRIVEINQIIKVIDDDAPKFELPEEYIIGMKSYTCGSFGKLPIPQNVLECGQWSYNVLTQQIDSLGNPLPASNAFVRYNNLEKVFYLDGAPEGRIWVYYEVFDPCGNIATHRIEVAVVDELLPIPVCDEKTVVTLTSNGTARIYAETFDDGSIDNCGILRFNVRRMTDVCLNGTDRFGPYVDFCCQDVGTTVTVVLEVVDNSRNKNTCMVQVVVQEKEPPVIIPPTDITVTCSFDLSDLTKFGSVRLTEAERKDIIINDYYYKAEGFKAGRDGLATDNCYVEVTEQVVRNITNCNQGTISRIFTAKDRQGLTSTVVQTIYVVNPFPFTRNDIIWPAPRTLYSCRINDIHPDITGYPVYNNISCANVAATYEDQLLSKVDTSCYKIFRKWTVLDWCQFNPQSNSGLWEYTQILYISNTVPPDLYSCGDLEICDYNSYYDSKRNACMVNFDIKGEGEDDCTRPENLIWSYNLDMDNDGQFESSHLGNRVTGASPVGMFRIRWVLEDQCGNKSTCIQRVILKDCKKPTPYCINGVVTVIMPKAGTITVWAKDLDINSFDNCTQKDKLIFSFSPDIKDNSRTYNCDSLGGSNNVLKTVRIYVTDESGNQDYCETTIRIQDNNNVCGTNLVNLTGNISRSNQSNMPDVKLALKNENNEILEEQLTNFNGDYSFKSIPVDQKYYLQPNKEDDILNGISTYDIILIQKHILGKGTLKDPYQLLAADVNNSSSITARDVSDIRKVILGVSNTFPCNTVWNFNSGLSNFKNPTEPWDINPVINLNEVIEDFSRLNFVGYKKGDIDQSAFLSLDKKIFTSRTFDAWKIDEPLEKNGQYWYPVKASSNVTLEGLQFSIQGQGITSLYSGKINILPSNYSLKGNELRVSWNEDQALEVKQNETVLYIITNTKVKFKFDQNELGLGSEYYTSDAVMPFSFIQSGSSSFESYLKIEQNVPNPYYDYTIIPIESSHPTSARLTIYDVTGKKMVIQNLILEKGKNYIRIDRQQIGSDGIYLYKLEGANDSQVRKMIIKSEKKNQI